MAIKTKYKMRHTNGLYETFHFETDADQVLTNSNRLFASQSEKNNWNAKETTSGAQAKADSAKNSAIASAKSYTDSVANGKANTNHNHDSAYLGKTATATAASKLATPRTINGVAFDGTSNITITANPNSHTHNYEPVFSKNTAFNKNFGTSAGTVAEGNHGHSGYATSNHTHSNYAASDHTHSNYALTSHSHSNYALTSHNHDNTYLPISGGWISGSIIGNANSTGEIAFKGSGENLNSGLYLNKDGRVGIYDWKNDRGVFQYNSNSGIMDFSPTCVFHGLLRADGGIYMGAQDVIYRSGSAYYFDVDGHWRNSQIQTGQFVVQPWSTEGTALYINRDGERTNGRTDLTIVPSSSNYGIFGRSSRHWYTAWSTSWRTPSYRKSKYDIMKADEERLYQYVKGINIYNYRRISGNEEDEKKPSDYRGDLQMGAMINELPFEVVDHDTEHGEGKGIDLYAYSSMVAGALKVAIKKIENLEEKINGLI